MPDLHTPEYIFSSCQAGEKGTVQYRDVRRLSPPSLCRPRWVLLISSRVVLSCCSGSPRKGHYGERSAKTSTATVFGRSGKEPQSSCAPASGSTFSSGRMAPRMKLVRKASRDLSADVQVRNSPQFGCLRISSASNGKGTDYHALINMRPQNQLVVSTPNVLLRDRQLC